MNQIETYIAETATNNMTIIGRWIILLLFILVIEIGIIAYKL